MTQKAVEEDEVKLLMEMPKKRPELQEWKEFQKKKRVDEAMFEIDWNDLDDRLPPLHHQRQVHACKPSASAKKSQPNCDEAIVRLVRPMPHRQLQVVDCEPSTSAPAATELQANEEEEKEGKEDEEEEEEGEDEEEKLYRVVE